MSQPIYTTGEAASLLGVSIKTVLRMCNKGQITAHKTSPDGQWRITRSTLVEYARQNGIPLQEKSSRE